LVTKKRPITIISGQLHTRSPKVKGRKDEDGQNTLFGCWRNIAPETNLQQNINNKTSVDGFCSK